MQRTERYRLLAAVGCMRACTAAKDLDSSGHRTKASSDAHCYLGLRLLCMFPCYQQLEAAFSACQKELEGLREGVPSAEHLQMFIPVCSALQQAVGGA